MPGENIPEVFLVDVDPHLVGSPFEGENMRHYLADLKQLMDFIKDLEGKNKNINLLSLYTEVESLYKLLQKN